MTQKDFLDGVQDGYNHRVLLWPALEMTSDSYFPVAEFGAGYGSTPFLRDYCKDADREFLSYDSNAEWASIWGSRYKESWRDPELYRRDHSVVLIDQAPGEYRHESMIALKDKATIIVVHDAEPDESMGYLLHTIWHLFKWRIFFKGTKIWSAAVSNHLDLSDLDGQLIGEYKLEL